MSSLEDVTLSLGAQPSQDYRRAVDLLEKLGLTQYESRIYVALVVRGYGDSTTLAEAAGIPRTSAYKVLEGLCQKGYVFATGGKPSIFKPQPIPDTVQHLKSTIDEVFEKLDQLHDTVAEHGEPELVYLLMGRDRVLSKIAEMLDQSTETFILTTPHVSTVRDELMKKIASAVKRGVKITFITAPAQKIPEGVHHIPARNILATDVLADGSRALLASPGLDACGFTENPILAEHLKQFLDIVMEKAATNK
jgi:sugar-specific transcriptional regulator TrmB